MVLSGPHKMCFWNPSAALCNPDHAINANPRTKCPFKSINITNRVCLADGQPIADTYRANLYPDLVMPLDILEMRKKMWTACSPSIPCKLLVSPVHLKPSCIAEPVGHRHTAPSLVLLVETPVTSFSSKPFTSNTELTFLVGTVGTQTRLTTCP